MIIENNIYDGSFIKKRFSLNIFKERAISRIGCIVSYVSPVELENAKVKEAINFCIELPDISTYAGVAFQRLFITNVAQYLSTSVLKSPIEIRNTLMVVNKEIISNGIILNEAVININERVRHIDAYMFYCGLVNKLGYDGKGKLYGMELSSSGIEDIIKNVENIFYNLASSVYLDTINT